MRFITPIILVVVALAAFFVFTIPTYNDLSLLRKEVASYNEALGNSKALENERDKLSAKYNALSRDDLLKLEKLLPENADNIRLILEIEQLAQPYGMTLRGVEYNAKAATSSDPSGITQGETVRRESRKDYGILELEFSTSGTYGNFLKFLRDLETNLRIVDVTEISFSSDTGANINKTSTTEVYEYTVKIKTYWLKN